MPAANLALDPVLAHLDILLVDDDFYQRVRRPQTATRGRHSTLVEVILRLLLVKRLYA